MADTTSLSSFPNNIDTFDRVSDISEQQGTLEKSQKYKKKIDDGKYADAEKYLRDNEDLAQCAINASMFNKHSDAIVALEEKSISDKQDTDNKLNEKIGGVELSFGSVFSSNSVDLKIKDSNNNNSSVNISCDSNLKFIKNNGRLEINTSPKLHRCALNSEITPQIKVCGSFCGNAEYQAFIRNSMQLSVSNSANGANFPLTSDIINDNIDWNNVSSSDLIVLNFDSDDFLKYLKIIDVSGFIITPSSENIPTKNYPLNSSNIEVYWSDYNKITQSPPTIYIKTNGINTSTGYATVCMFLKFICNRKTQFGSELLLTYSG